MDKKPGNYYTSGNIFEVDFLYFYKAIGLLTCWVYGYLCSAWFKDAIILLLTHLAFETRMLLICFPLNFKFFYKIANNRKIWKKLGASTRYNDFRSEAYSFSWTFKRSFVALLDCQRFLACSCCSFYSEVLVFCRIRSYQWIVVYISNKPWVSKYPDNMKYDLEDKECSFQPSVYTTTHVVVFFCMHYVK